MFFRRFLSLAKRSQPVFNRYISNSIKKSPVPNRQKLFASTTTTGIALIAGVIIYNSKEASLAPVSNIDALKKEIQELIADDDEKRDDGTSIGPTLVRLAWHASGTYNSSDKTGGSNGSTMRYHPEASWGANAGLKSARDFLEPLKAKYNISYADLWTLAGATAIEAMGGPQIPWRSGRSDSPNPTTVPDGRLPDAKQGHSHIREVFTRLGFNDRETVALIGAHALGRCHENASGFWGPWTRAETTFSNEYFRLLLEEKWTVKKTHLGKPWKGPLQYESPDKAIMMLPADLALLDDPEYKKYVELYAKDEKVFFADFAAAFSKLLELGVVFPRKKLFGIF